ncbi:rhodanese-like domain-containing protein [Pseudopedobacter beijingensis]|uniref:Rhodanese-like domain-containing protein n=1 Tax=Pseudopedobacter beijingensis TaxID=1207056 RepID=A0ABW4IEW9_9SPHI
MEDIQSEDFLKLLQELKLPFILDVREALEYHTYNIGGINIPLAKIQQSIDEEELELDKNQEIIVICQRGIRSKTAKTILQQNGFKNVRNLTGGLVKLQQYL